MRYLALEIGEFRPYCAHLTFPDIITKNWSSPLHPKTQNQQLPSPNNNNTTTVIMSNDSDVSTLDLDLDYLDNNLADFSKSSLNCRRSKLLTIVGLGTPDRAEVEKEAKAKRVEEERQVKIGKLS